MAVAAAVGVLALKLIDLPAVDRWYSARPLWLEIASQRDRVCVATMHRSWRYGLNYYSVTPLAGLQPVATANPDPAGAGASPGTHR